MLLEYFTWKTEENQTRAVFVDKSIQILKIVIKGATRKEEVDFFYPNGKHLFLFYSRRNIHGICKEVTRFIIVVCNISAE